MSKEYLTREELYALIRSDGKPVMRKTVMRWLNAERWPYVLGIDGWPRILRAYHDAVLSGQPVNARKQIEPTWSKAA